MDGGHVELHTPAVDLQVDTDLYQLKIRKNILQKEQSWKMAS